MKIIVNIGFIKKNPNPLKINFFPPTINSKGNDIQSIKT